MLHGAFVFRAIIGVELAPIAGYVPPKERGRGIAGAFKRRERAGRGDDLAGRKTGIHTAARKPASLAVAWYCGMGSSSLNAEVNALESDQAVRGRKSSC